MRNKTFNLTVLPQAETKGSRKSLGLRLRQQCQFLTVALFVTTVSWKELIKTKVSSTKVLLHDFLKMFIPFDISAESDVAQ